MNAELAQAGGLARCSEIECFSFAGPTAGNEAFVARYNPLLSRRTRRFVNRRDIVPHAWVPSELKKLEAIYPVLVPVLRVLAASIGHLGYAHVGGELIEFPARSHLSSPGPEIAYQHLDAYLIEAGLPPNKWNAASLFLSN